uniref:Chitin-binding type-2 domain-containing protein n=1 Tax=Acrobeloides nanus TaxID=290746 RepID=A0A914EIC1_9BILA
MQMSTVSGCTRNFDDFYNDAPFDCINKPAGYYPLGFCQKEYVLCAANTTTNFSCDEGQVYSMQNGKCTIFRLISLCNRINNVDNYYMHEPQPKIQKTIKAATSLLLPNKKDLSANKNDQPIEKISDLVLSKEDQDYCKDLNNGIYRSGKLSFVCFNETMYDLEPL